MLIALNLALLAGITGGLIWWPERKLPAPEPLAGMVTARDGRQYWKPPADLSYEQQMFFCKQMEFAGLPVIWPRHVGPTTSDCEQGVHVVEFGSYTCVYCGREDDDWDLPTETVRK